MKFSKSTIISTLVLVSGFGLILSLNQVPNLNIEDSVAENTQSEHSATSNVMVSETSSSQNASNKHPQSLSTVVAPGIDSLIDPESKPILEQMFPKDDPAWIWAQVDLEGLKREMPDNLYWLLAAPSQEESVLEYRKEQKSYWDQQYARVLSNNANEEEIRDYYAHQHKVSNDYVVFITALLNRYSSILPEQAYKLQTLARNMHLTRLEEIPKRLNRALENRSHFTQKRETWLADKEAYESRLASEREAALRELGKI